VTSNGRSQPTAPSPTSRLLRVVLVGGAAVALAPLLVMAWHAFPSADDYCLAVEARKGFWAMQLFFYQEWTGRYAAMLFQAILGRWDLATVYRWFCLATVLATILACRSLLGSVSEGARVRLTGAAIVASAVFSAHLPSSAEAFFWMSSALSYQWGLIVFLAWLSSLVRIATGPNAGAAGPRVVATAPRVVATALTVLMPGFAEVLSPLALLTLAGFVIHCRWRKREAQGFLITLLVLAAALTAASLLAPGNSVRSATYPANPTRHSLEFAVVETLWQTIRFIGSYGLHPALWMAATATVVWRLPVRASIDRALGGGRGPVLALAGTMAGVYLTLFPLYWEYGDVNYTGEGRTYNVTYFVLCIGSALVVRSLLRTIGERHPLLWTRVPVHLRDRAMSRCSWCRCSCRQAPFARSARHSRHLSI
jgi:hypothetical protein